MKRLAAAILLVAMMATGTATINASPTEGYRDDNHGGDFSTESVDDIEAPDAIEMPAEYLELSPPDPPSERRMKYNNLLMCGLTGGALREKFVEMFGDHDSRYVRENYAELFDVTSDEIDEGLLNIIAGEEYDDEIYAEWLESAKEFTGERLDLFRKATGFVELPKPTRRAVILPPTEDVLLPPKSETQTVKSQAAQAAAAVSASVTYVSKTNTSVTMDIAYSNTTDINNILKMYDTLAGTWTNLLGRDGKPTAVTQRYTATGLTAGNVYRFIATTYDSSTSTWKDSEIKVQTTGAKTAALTKGSSMTTSFSVVATYPVEGMWGNRLEYHNGTAWVDVTGRGYNSTSGTYTISGVIPGKTYNIILSYYDHMTGTWPESKQVTCSATLPAETYTTYSKTNTEFKMEPWLCNTFSSGRLTNFLNKTDAAYTVIKDFTGGVNTASGASKQRFETTRTLIGTQIEGVSGQPIIWGVLSAADHVVRMNGVSADLTEAPLHEYGHNFQSWRWNFEGEALTYFQTYQYMKTSGEKMAVSNVDTVITGGPGYKTYIKSQANRVLGHINYDAAMAQNVYSPYSLAYSLAVISDSTGFDAFKKTFAYFNDITAAQVPTANIGKFNLFMTKLQDFSGVNVFNLLSTKEKQIYGQQLGGTIALVNNPPIAYKVAYFVFDAPEYDKYIPSSGSANHWVHVTAYNSLNQAVPLLPDISSDCPEYVSAWTIPDDNACAISIKSIASDQSVVTITARGGGATTAAKVRLLKQPSGTDAAPDVPSHHWARTGILYSMNQNLLTMPYSNAFLPEGAVTYGTLTKSLGALLGVKLANNSESTYYTWAYDLGFVGGASSGIFANTNVNRKDVCKVISDFCSKYGIVLPVSGNNPSFTDLAMYTTADKTHVNQLYRAGLIGGYTDLQYAPSAPLLRGDLANILYRLCQSPLPNGNVSRQTILDYTSTNLINPYRFWHLGESNYKNGTQTNSAVPATFNWAPRLSGKLNLSYCLQNVPVSHPIAAYFTSGGILWASTGYGISVSANSLDAKLWHIIPNISVWESLIGDPAKYKTVYAITEAYYTDGAVFNTIEDTLALFPGRSAFDIDIADIFYNPYDEAFIDLDTYTKKTALVAHEIGHAIGFGHHPNPHNPSVATIMKQGAKTFTTLQYCDFRGLRYKY